MSIYKMKNPVTFMGLSRSGNQDMINYLDLQGSVTSQSEIRVAFSFPITISACLYVLLTLLDI